MQLGRQQYKYVLCDIDGTMADISHRLHHIKTRPKNWMGFMKGIPDDAVVWPVYSVMEAMARAGYRVIMLSGRGSEWRKQTEEWLMVHAVPHDELLMRAAKDYRGDEIVKQELFETRFSAAEKQYVLGVFDDRPKVIKMWRSIGVKVFDVGTGVDF